ncbi:MAG: hypothetical protein Q9184_004693 [Pyrenodesmia sp. 2 TL-2023]
MTDTALSLDIADPSDWLKSTAPKLAPVEAALRCQVCKDFFDTPMITSCSHTFCSLCIRRCLTSDGKCPACRAPDQELRLRRNWTVQEVVDAFEAARPSLTSLATTQAEESKAKLNRGKRKVEDTDWDEDAEDLALNTTQRRTRSRSRRQAQSPLSEPTSDSTGDGMESVADRTSTEDGLAACPICGRKMKEEAVFLHLDTHNEPDAIKAINPTRLRLRRSPSIEIVGRSRAQRKALERLPQLNYSLMKDTALRKKLSDLGIPSTGPRALLMRRHAEWVNIVNANADSLKPKTKREMLRELDVWDRSTGRSIGTSGTDLSTAGSIMSRDFDGTAWSANHKSDFDDLISKARHISKVPKSFATNQTTDEPIMDITHLPTNHAPSAGVELRESGSTARPDPEVTLSASPAT